MTAQPTIPPGGQFDPNAAFQGNMQMLAPGGSGAQQQANVPLWLVRPSSSGPGSSVMADRNIAGDQNGAGSANAAEEDARRQPASIANGQKFYSKDAAQSGWFDLSDDEKRAFMAKAQASGFWDPSQGMDNLVHAWYYAVELASQYNDNHKQDQWISPFEAVSKMAMQNVANKNGRYDGTTTETTVNQFTENDLYSTAKAVLQRNLGRDPTPDELKAFTIAVNHAASQTPQVVTTQSSGGAGTVDPSTGQPIPRNVQRVVYGQGSFNPEQIMDEQVRKTDEYAMYQAAVDYFPAVMNALGAIA